MWAGPFRLPEPLGAFRIHLILVREAVRSRCLRAAQSPVGDRLFLDSQPGELLVELRNLAAAVDDPVLPRPCRMRLRIDVQTQRVAGLAVAGPRLELRAV